MKRYVSKVIKDPDSADLIMLLPDDLLKDLALIEGEFLEWQLEGRSILIRRHNIVAPDTEEQTQQEEKDSNG